MVDLTGRQWQQLQLPGMRMSHIQRPPQGYTPDRIAEVRQALPEVISMNDKVHPGHAREQVARAIARSTVPPHHLEGVGRIFTGNVGLDSGTAGVYGTVYPRPAGRPFVGDGQMEIGMRADFGTSYGRRASRRFQQSMRERTLVHEIGHNVDNLGGRALREAGLDNRDAREANLVGEPQWRHGPGTSEALAENYADVHYLGPRKGPSARSSYDPSVSSGYYNRQWGRSTVAEYKRLRKAGTLPGQGLVSHL